jgi:PEP-CTERM motif
MKQSKSTLGAAIAASALFAAVVSPASAMLLVYNDEPSGMGILEDVNQATAAVSNSRSTIPGLVGIEFGAGGTLYGLSSEAASSPNSLYSIDPSDGSATLIGSTGLSNILEGDLAFDPTTNTLWGAYDLATPNMNFFTLNTTTGAATFAFGLTASFADYSAMAFDGAGNLFVLNTQSSTQDSLLKVDKTSGAVLDEILLTDSGNAANLTNGGMDFDPVTGNMYVTDGGTKVLYTLDTTDGKLSFISISTIGDQLTGLTVAPQGVPEPGMLLLLGAGLAGLGFSRRRR